MLIELFVKADLTRANNGRKTLHVRDVQFAKYLTDNKELLTEALVNIGNCVPKSPESP
jgi:hypothetical protein